MEEEKMQKLNYINENIIEKGYNPEELSNYVIKKTGIPMDNLNFEKLKEMIEQFKDQGLQDAYQSIKIKEVGKKKEESPFDLLYSTQSYEIKTKPQQKNKLLELEEQKQIITITVSEPKKEKTGGFFSKPIYSYRIVTTIIDKDVRRTYADFEWLREQLYIRYALGVVPPIFKENAFLQMDIIEKGDTEEIIEQKKAKYLNIFLNKLLKRKIYRTSPLLLEFLELDDANFKKYKEKINKSKYELSISLDNLRTMGGKIKCEIKKENINKADDIFRKTIKLTEIYQKLEKSLLNIISDFNLLENHMKEVSNQFDLLSNEFNQDVNHAKIKNIFSDLSKLYDQWSLSYANQKKFFKDDFKFMFKYINSETQEISPIIKKYISFKSEYEDFTVRINKKKEELFEQKDYSKWSLAPGTESQLPMFQNNKKIAFEKMLYKETFLLSEEKKRIACTLYLLFKQFNKIIKNQSNELEEYFKKLKEKNELVLGDAHNVIKMFSLIAENKEENKENKKENKEENKEENKDKNENKN